MKRVLILAIGCNVRPWDKMFDTSLETWEAVKVEGMETSFYFGNPAKHHLKAINFDLPETYANMGRKMLSAFEWVLKDKHFDYIARVNSSCYADKKQLIKHVQDLPDKNVLSGIKIDAGNQYPFEWLWGGGQFILSRDVVERIWNSRDLWRHDLMEDVALSHIALSLGIPFTDGKACAIDKTENGWRIIQYGGGESFEFTDFEKMKETGQHFYRVKQDLDRSRDAYLMHELYKTLA